MPELSTYGKYPIPTSPESPDAPAQFKALVEALDQHTVLKALNAADRDSQYSSVKPGTIVSTTLPPWSMWQKKDSGWNSLYEDTGWVTFPAEIFTTDFDDVGSAYRTKNSHTQLSFRLQYTGADLVAPASGNIGDVLVAQLPDQAKPVRSQEPSVFLASTVGWVDCYVNGDVKLTHMLGSTTLATNTILYASFNFFRD